jgi:topoisomerase-4 subunit A
MVTRFPVRKIALKTVGKSTLGALRLWMDEVSGKLNTDARGIFLGEFDTGDRLLLLYKEGAYEIMEIDQNRRFNPEEVIFIGKYAPDLTISAVHFDGHKGWTMVKRFHIETSTLDQRFSFLTDHKDSRLLFASTKPNPRIQYSVRVRNKKIPGELSIAEFIDVKGWKALGNKLSDQKLGDVAEIDTPADSTAKLHAGDTIDFDIDPAAPQGTLFT